MTFTDLAKRAERIVSDNSPVILTAIGVSGTLVTAFLTGKATVKATELVYKKLEERPAGNYPHQLDSKETVLLVWKLYIPAASTAVITITAIIGSNRIGARRAAAIASVYSISEKAFAEYREKVVEKIGINKERAIRDDIAQDRVNRNPTNTREVIITGNGDVLCFETFTGRYFNSSMETLKKAQNDMNYQILHEMYASLSEFYHKVGLPVTSFSDEVGWKTDRLMELEFSTTLSDDGRPCIVVGYLISPTGNFYKLG